MMRGWQAVIVIGAFFTLLVSCAELENASAARDRAAAELNERAYKRLCGESEGVLVALMGHAVAQAFQAGCPGVQ